MVQVYEEPELIDLGGDFRVNLYRSRTEVDRFGVVEPKKRNGVNGTNRDTNDTIFDLISSNPKIKQKEIRAKTGLSLSTVKRIMSVLQQTGRIERKGSSRSGEWIVKK